MARPFVNRAPTPQEVERIRLALSTFADGSGQEKDSQGNTRAGWRDFERVISEILGGTAPENKDIFDVILAPDCDSELAYGLSIKSKKLSRRSAIRDLDDGGRVYMELCNSPAKLWRPLFEIGLSEPDFSSRKCPNEIGESLLKTVLGWHAQAKTTYERQNHKELDLNHSCYLTISYGEEKPDRPREYQLHAFGLEFVSGIQWQYVSEKCLRGFDPAHPTEPLLDWYGLSGGQLKYYPRASDARFKTPRFQLEQPTSTSISEKTFRYWPQKWVAAGGSPIQDPQILIKELATYRDMIDDAGAGTHIDTCVRELTKLFNPQH